VVVVIALLFGGAAAAQPGTPVEQASALYEHGQDAHRRGDYREAARAFAAADELVPDPAALEAGLVAVLETEDAALAMLLATRATRDESNTRLAGLATQARLRFAAKAGRVVVHCNTCTAAIDRTPLQRGVATWVTVGDHEVVIDVDGKTDRRVVRVEPASITTILPLPSPSPSPSPSPLSIAAPDPDSPPPETTGASPAWYWSMLGITAVVGAGTIASGVDTASKHADFVDAPTADAALAGEEAQTRTNALIGVTAGLAAITAVVGLFVVDWSTPGSNAYMPPSSQLSIRF
jgi:hypothetical protein